MRVRTFGLLLFLLESTQVSNGIPVDLRLPALAFLALSLLNQRDSVRVPAIPLLFLASAGAVAGAQFLLVDELETLSTEPIQGLLFGTVAVIALCQSGALRPAGYLLFALSLSGIPGLLDGGRTTGVFLNENSLGIAAVVAVGLLGGVRAGPRIWLPMVCTILASGSRASLAALVLLALVELRHRVSQKERRRWAIGALIAATTLLTFFDSRVLRTNNSRDRTIEVGLEAAFDAWPTGRGMGSRADAIIASSAIRVVVELGFAGALLYIAFTAIAIRRTVNGTNGLVAALLFHSLFEGWFISGGSWILIIALTVLVREPESSPSAGGGSSLGSRSSSARQRPGFMLSGLHPLRSGSGATT